MPVGDKGATMRNLACFAIFILLAGCGGNRSVEHTDNSSSEAVDCINREAVIIAPSKVDLETAATAVVAKCSIYTEATRRKLIQQYPGYRDYMAPKLKELDDTYMDGARRAVAIARTSH
jgi:hypothetical protein